MTTGEICLEWANDRLVRKVVLPTLWVEGFRLCVIVDDSPDMVLPARGPNAAVYDRRLEGDWSDRRYVGAEEGEVGDMA